jgi:hypothetical protein
VSTAKHAPMTRDEALREAQRRWGKHAFARQYSEPTEFTVGPSLIYGHSEDSWEAAFADADAKAEGDNNV